MERNTERAAAKVGIEGSAGLCGSDDLASPAAIEDLLDQDTDWRTA